METQLSSDGDYDLLHLNRPGNSSHGVKPPTERIVHAYEHAYDDVHVYDDTK